MSALFMRVIGAGRKRLFGQRPIFEPYRRAVASDLERIESRLGCSLPHPLRAWLLHAGYGDLNEEMSLREEWFRVVDRGQLKGHVIFGQDILGNFYCFSPANGEVHFVCRSAHEYALMASDFGAFLEELERRSFKLVEWTDGLKVASYD
jgi:hypothetical protein